MAVKLNLSGKQKLEDLDRPNNVEPGWYKAKVADTRMNEDESAEIITFAVVGGRFDGCLNDMMLVHPNVAGEKVTNEHEREKKIEQATRRIQAIAYRLGIITKDMLGSEVDIEFANAMGREVVIDCESREYTKKDGTKGTAVGIKYLGVYPLDHEDIPDDVRKDLRLGPARVTHAGGHSPSKKPAVASTKSDAKPAKKIDLSDM